MGSKPVMVSAPVMILIYDRVFVSGSFLQLLRNRWKLHAGMFAMWGLAILLLLNYVATGTHVVAVASPLSYLITQLGVITHYLRLAVWPDSLCLDYMWPIASGLRDVLLPAIFIVCLVALTLWAVSRYPAAGFCGAWFFITLAPSSSILPLLDNAFEHRMYLSLASVIVLLVVGFYQLLMRICGRKKGAVARRSCCLCSCCGRYSSNVHIVNHEEKRGL